MNAQKTRGARPAVTEAEFLATVRQLASLTGWITYHTHDSRRSDAGFPDLVLVHRRQARTVFAELKTATGRLSPEQVSWLSSLHDAGAEAAVWRPRHIEEIKRILRGASIPDEHLKEVLGR